MQICSKEKKKKEGKRKGFTSMDGYENHAQDENYCCRLHLLLEENLKLGENDDKSYSKEREMERLKKFFMLNRKQCRKRKIYIHFFCSLIGDPFEGFI